MPKPRSKQKAAAKPAKKPAAKAKVPKNIGDANAGNANTRRLVLSNYFTIDMAQDFYAELDSALQSESDVEIDGSNVERVDSAGIQLLLSFKNEFEKHSSQIQWLGASDSLRATAEQLGVESELRFPENQN